jgi:hypothetical protein
MSDGRFGLGIIALASDGMWVVPVIMNGQHQLEAIILSGIPVECVVLSYVCETAADFSNLFCEFNVDRIRNLAEQSRVIGDAMGLTWPKRTVGLIVSAASLNSEGRIIGKLSTTSRAKRLRTVREEGGFVNFVFGQVENREHRHLRRAPVVAMMMTTWRKSHSNAETFWIRVRDGEMLSKDDPEYLVREFLRANGPRIGSQGWIPASRQIASHEFMYRIALAWNAVRRGEKRTILPYRFNKDVPQCI